LDARQVRAISAAVVASHPGIGYAFVTSEGDIVMNEDKYQGVFSVIQVPFLDDYSIDVATLQCEIDWVIGHGVSGLVLAMASEIFRFTDVERDGVIANTAAAANQRVPVVASVGAESIPQLRRNIAGAQDAGADAVMAIPPTLVKCNAAAMRGYFDTILELFDGPVFIQDASSYLGNAIPISVQVDLYKSAPDRIKFKPEAQPVGASISALRDATDGAPIFEGMGGVTLMDNYRRGICGTMPGSEIPWVTTRLWQALLDGDLKTAQRIQGPLSSLIAMLPTIDAFITVEKLFLHEQGIFPNTLIRPPVGFSLDAETRAEFMRLLTVLKDVCANIPG
jgi:dihydrodipicolinate synthase/N-acetylneuraminate lyase